jgi:hypothetical protein
VSKERVCVCVCVRERERERERQRERERAVLFSVLQETELVDIKWGI